MNTHLWRSGPDVPGDAPADVTVGCHRRLRGPYTGAGTLARALVPGAYARWPELVRLHAIEILSTAPELKDRIGASPQTLTSLAVPEERTRIYAAARTRRLAHGLVEFLHAYAALRDRGPLTLAFTDVDEADPTDQEFLAILLRRSQGLPLAVTVGTRGGTLSEELESALEQYATRATPAPPPVAAARGDRDETGLLNAYIDSDGTSDDPDERSAYQAADPAVRAALHDRRAARLLGEGDWSLRLGAVPYHLEHGSDPAGAGGDALHEAVYYAAGLGFWPAVLDYARRARAVVDPEQAERYWDFCGKMASAYGLLGRTREAERLYVEVRGRYPLPMAQMFTGYALAMLYTRMHPPELRDHHLAKAYLSNTITLASLLPDAEQRAFHWAFQRNGMALVEMHLGNLPEALRLVTSALEHLDAELPADRHRLHRSVLVHNRGRVYAALGRLPEALADLTTVIGLDPNYPDYYFDRADMLHRLGEDTAALADYDTALALGPPFWEVHFNRADLRAATGDTEGALADLRRVVELEPTELDARVNLVGLLLETGRPEEAAPLVREGLRLAPSDARLLLARGQLAWEAGHTESARRDFDLALSADPDCVPALAARAGLAFEAGDLAGALRDLNHAVETDPADPDLRYNRGYVHQTAGALRAAVDDYTTALALPGADPADLLSRRAHCYRELGEEEAAQADLKTAAATAMTTELHEAPSEEPPPDGETAGARTVGGPAGDAAASVEETAVAKSPHQAPARATSSTEPTTPDKETARAKSPHQAAAGTTSSTEPTAPDEETTGAKSPHQAAAGDRGSGEAAASDEETAGAKSPRAAVAGDRGSGGAVAWGESVVRASVSREAAEETAPSGGAGVGSASSGGRRSSGSGAGGDGASEAPLSAGVPR
ncbi:tetratricopeptide repeat protein [Streptomyces sp. 7R007]